MNRVLLITYYFPPSLSTGALRVKKFFTYLPNFNWEPFVLTTNHPISGNPDSAFPDGISANVQITVCNSFKLKFKGVTWISRWLPFCGPESFWLQPAVKTGMKLIRENKIDLIWSTALPPVSHLIGRQLKKKTGLPLVLDYRDLWSLNPLLSPKLAISRWIDRKLELETLASADAVVTISEKMGEQLQSMTTKPLVVKTIPNGFDPLDFGHQMIKPMSNIVAHIGNIYGKRTKAALHFINALSEFEQSYPDTASNLTLRFVGTIDPTISVDANKILKIVKLQFENRVSHLEAIQKMKEATVLLVFLELEECGSITSKIFECIATGRPILVIGRSAELEKMIVGLDDCRIVDGSNPLMTAEVLHDLMRIGIQPIENFKYRENFLGKFSGQKLTGDLADVFNGLVSS